MANILCPDCKDGKLHSEANKAQYHPNSGHGFAPELAHLGFKGWTTEALMIEHEQKLAKQREEQLQRELATKPAPPEVLPPQKVIVVQSPLVKKFPPKIKRTATGS